MNRLPRYRLEGDGRVQLIKYGGPVAQAEIQITHLYKNHSCRQQKKECDDEKKQILSNSLTERHARAFIRIKDPSVRARMIDRAVKKNLSAVECENEISALLAEKEKPPAPSPKPKRISLVRDINFFLNSVNRAVSLFSESGVQIKKETKDLGDCIEIVLNVKKA